MYSKKYISLIIEIFYSIISKQYKNVNIHNDSVLNKIVKIFIIKYLQL